MTEKECHHKDNCSCSHDHQAEIEIYNMTIQEKFDKCSLFHIQGLALMEELQFLRAKNKFQKILIYLDYTFSTTNQEENEYSCLQKNAKLNIAICSFKLQQYREVITGMNDSFINDFPDCICKAYLYLGKARRELGEFEQAKTDFQLALLHENNNDEKDKILEEIEILQLNKKLYHQQTIEFGQNINNNYFIKSEVDRL